MNWFGLFTMAMLVVLAVWIFAYEFGYEQAEKDLHMSREWTMRNHPTNNQKGGFMPSVYKKGSVPTGVPSVYVGRPSKWGNPFAMNGEKDREKVIAQFTEYIMNSPDLLAQVSELKGKNLVCYCAPKACHADVLLKLANG